MSNGVVFSGPSLFCFRITNKWGSITSLSMYSFPVIFLSAQKTKSVSTRSDHPNDHPPEEFCRHLREMGGVEGVDGSEAELLIVTGPVVEGREGKIIEHQVPIKGVGVEPELIPEANPGHVRPRRSWHGRSRGVPIEIRVSAAPHVRQGKRRRRHLLSAAAGRTHSPVTAGEGTRTD